MPNYGLIKDVLPWNYFSEDRSYRHDLEARFTDQEERGIGVAAWNPSSALDVDIQRSSPPSPSPLSSLAESIFGNVPNSPSAYRYAPEPVANQIDYFDAPYAEKYGMSAETAYQEALANSAHQREMADLKAAGLNPVLTASRGSGADVFAGSAIQASSGSGSSGRSSSAKGFLSTLVGSVVTLATGRAGKGNAARNLIALFER